MDRRRFLRRMLFAGGLAAAATAGPGIGLVLADDDTDDDTTTATDAAPRRRRFRTRGEITAIGSDPTTIQVDGRWIVVDSDVNPDLSLNGELAVGDVVIVVGYVEYDGDETLYIAQRVGTLDASPQRKQRFRVVGELTAWDQDAGVLAVDGEEIPIDEDVQPLRRVVEGLEVGDFVLVAGVVLDGARYAALIRRGDRRRREGQRFQVRGRLTEVGEDSIVVDGQTIRLSDQTQVRGDLVVGRFALVRGVRPPDGDPLAVQVVVLPDGVEPRAPSRPIGPALGDGRTPGRGRGCGRGRDPSGGDGFGADQAGARRNGHRPGTGRTLA
jgi:hypothetical protein